MTLWSLSELGVSEDGTGPQNGPSSPGLRVDVPKLGDWFHISKPAISVGDEISPSE